MRVRIAFLEGEYEGTEVETEADVLANARSLHGDAWVQLLTGVHLPRSQTKETTE